MKPKFFVYVDGLLIKNERILLVKRNYQPFKGYWHTIGGQVERNESLKNALKREFKEETGLNIEAGNIIGWRIEKTHDRTKLIAIFNVTSVNGEIKLNDEAEEYAWFKQEPPNSVFDYSKFLNYSKFSIKTEVIYNELPTKIFK